MAKLNTSAYKGVRDFYPEDKFIQNYIFKIWRETSERFGFEEYDASILEHTEIYKEKSGDEIVNEQTYTFIDRGGRDVTLRPEMTPTIARMVAGKRRELGFPLRWYSIPNLFRYEATQRGRLREHWQLNVDTFGIVNPSAEIEMIALADRIMKAFGAKSTDYQIRLNSNDSDKTSLKIVFEALKKSGIDNVIIDETLLRGQAYYTGIVFEFFDTNLVNSRSILGGGRYDNLTTLFGDSDLSAVGMGIGDVTMRDFLETHGLLPKYSPATKLYLAIIDMGNLNEIVKIIINLRVSGVNVAVDWSGRKIGDQIKAADKLKVPFVMVVGENELKNNIYSVKNLSSGAEKELKIDEISEYILNN
ncbi:MAG: histidine--tRNA ligase [bacterium]|nr:histidine--tRNA ligase [bacterium]